MTNTLEQRARELLAAEVFPEGGFGADLMTDMLIRQLGKVATAQALSAIEAALRLSAGADWVPCSERLPERDGLGAVLAFDSDRPRKGVWLETTHPSWWGKFMEESNEWGPTITHWQALPAAPRHETGKG